MLQATAAAQTDEHPISIISVSSSTSCYYYETNIIMMSGYTRELSLHITLPHPFNFCHVIKREHFDAY